MALLPRTKQQRSRPLSLLGHYQRAQGPQQQTRARGTLRGAGHGAAGGGGLLLAGRLVVIALALVLVALLQSELKLLLLGNGLLRDNLRETLQARGLEPWFDSFRG